MTTILTVSHISLYILAILSNDASSQESFSPFNFDSGRPFEPPDSPDTNASSLIWQPLRSSFRPLNREPVAPLPPRAPRPPSPPRAPTPPQPPSLPESLALVSGEFDQPPSSETTRFSAFNNFFSPLGSSSSFASESNPVLASVSRTPNTATTPTTTTLRPDTTFTTLGSRIDLEDEQPTRIPMSRFRPTRAPSDDKESIQPSTSRVNPDLAGANRRFNSHSDNSTTTYTISNECFECICEASTNCNQESRCQTSDVRHTKCGMFLISYDQWLATGLSKRLVSSAALARDVAADERGYYECVTNRECAQEVISIYMQSNARDCDKDGRIDCYDIASIHQGGIDQCNSETFLESQFWSDFNACYGFAR